ncbi:aldehyde dehydrogenase family protein [Rathayibacter soli]|uniref:aldehyde dehydrogenase family protein n=1 Tax=Rathayibacter soli TaxID=3144168 RepID=UPI0027E41DB6|nr:aldehyde dehydrogenase family protein [Glaciibacter superstes]
MTTLDLTLRDAFNAYKDLVDETEPLLTALDEHSGDGDFGANLRGGLTLTSARVENIDGRQIWGVLAGVFLDEVGGTSGPLFGLLFQQLHDAMTAADSISSVLRDGGRRGLEAVKRVGEAQVGDRTLIDALEPGVAALAASDDLGAAVGVAVSAALSTRDLVARRGRASYVGRRAVGYPDPGAVGIALLFIAFGRAAGADVRSALDHLLGMSNPAALSDNEVISELEGEGVEEVLAAAYDAQVPLAGLTLRERAHLLDVLADALEANSDELVEIAVEETHLIAGRLFNEVARTSFQLRLFADLVRSGEFLDVRLDSADPTWPVAPRPDLRRSNRPIGPVLVFAASNFPFAFSVLGGDTASALAAGNPVVVKAHPGHMHLSRRTMQFAVMALSRESAPAGTLSLIEGKDNGVSALADRRIKAAAFTGSIRGGRALFTVAQARPDPIPFFGELGSNNPVFVTASADADGAHEIADGFVRSFTQSAGQLCTKPGTLFVPAGSEVIAALRQHALPAPAELLNESIRAGFRDRLRGLRSAPHVNTLRSDGDPYAESPAPIILHARGEDVLARPSLYLDECFGPAALVVEYDSAEQMVQLAEAYEGQLTATIFGTDTDSPTHLVNALAARAGRLLWRQWPTGVSVTGAQQHGGPYPASTAPQTTSVGTGAITRFLRPVALQGFPQRLLPSELKTPD